MKNTSQSNDIAENVTNIDAIKPKKTRKQKSPKDEFIFNLKDFMPNENYYFHHGLGRVVHLEIKHDSNGDEKEIITPICSALAITSLTHSEDLNEGGLLLQWVDRQNSIREWVLPQSLLSKGFSQVAETLQRNRIIWLPVEPKAQRYFMDFLQSSIPEKTILYTEKTGWHDGCFVFPDHIVGSKEIVFQSTSAKHKPPKIVGDIELWKSKIGAYCIGNPTLVLGVCSALANPLNGLMGISASIFHLMGASSRGKTLSIGINCSVFGFERGSWRGTDNAKESELEARNHIGITLDELGQSTPKDAYQIAYMIGNGQGKGRANKDGSAQRIREFNTTALSTGELSLDSFLSMAGKDVTGGLSVRFIQGQSDIFAYGCFDNIHEFKSGSEFATYLGQVTGITGDTYNPVASGSIGIEYIKLLSQKIGNDIKTISKAKDTINKIAKDLTPKDADSQVSRMSVAVAGLIYAGETATKWGLTGWEKGTATKEISIWWNQCVLPCRGGNGSTEEQKALEQVKDFFELHHMSHFTVLGSGELPAKNSGVHFGYVDESGNNQEPIYYVSSAGWKEITKGYNPQMVAKQCIAKGWLMEHSVKGKLEPYKNKKIGQKTMQAYWFKFPN